MALIEERGDLEGGDVSVRLPGVKQGDMADRKVKPEVSRCALYDIKNIFLLNQLQNRI